MKTNVKHQKENPNEMNKTNNENILLDDKQLSSESI